jgi:hypothetical protein
MNPSKDSIYSEKKLQEMGCDSFSSDGEQSDFDNWNQFDYSEEAGPGKAPFFSRKKLE